MYSQFILALFAAVGAKSFLRSSHQIALKDEDDDKHKSHRCRTKELGESGKKVVAITGATQGIGFEAAKQYAEKGYYTIITSLHESNLKDGDDAVSKILEAAPENNFVCWVHLEIGPNMNAGELIDAVNESGGELGGLVNNAGIAGDVLSVPDGGKIDRRMGGMILDTNYYGTKALIESLEKNKLFVKDSFVVNVSSDTSFLNMNDMSENRFKELKDANEKALGELVAAFVKRYMEKDAIVGPAAVREAGIRDTSGFKLVAYSFSKALLNRYTEILANNWKEEHPERRVTAVNPGFCRTAITHGLTKIKGAPDWNKLRDPAACGADVVKASEEKESGKYYEMTVAAGAKPAEWRKLPLVERKAVPNPLGNSIAGKNE